MTVTVRQLADWVRGEVLGDGDLAISNARTLADAQPGDITFIDGHRNLGAWHDSKASAAVAPISVPVNGRPLIHVADPLMAFARIVEQLRGRPLATPGAIDPTAHIHPTAKLGEGISVGPFVVIGEGTEIGANSAILAGAIIGRSCRLGTDCILHPRAVMYDDCILGDRVTIHANAVIGADGFGYRMQGGRHVKVPQLGWVEIGDDVEIGAGTTIDRGTFGPTTIGQGTKIDNQVMIAHNCRIGRHNILAAQVGIAGSCKTGDFVVMAGQVGVADHLEIGDRSVLGAKTGVVKPIPADARVTGWPARPDTAQKRVWVMLEHLPETLPEIRKDLRRIKEKLGMEDPK